MANTTFDDPVVAPSPTLRRAGLRRWLGPVFAASLALPACGGSDGGSDGGTTIVYEPYTVLDISPDSPTLADPHVIRVDGTWYLYATDSSPGYQVFTSDDLSTWRNRGTVWAPTAGTWNDQGNIWAPHIEVTGEGYYLYYTANLRIGVAWAASPLGPFEEVLDHPLVGDGHGGVGDGTRHFSGTPLAFLDNEENAIDAYVHQGADGSLTFYYVAPRPFNAIYGVPMRDFVTLENVPATLLVAPGILSWEGFVAEAPWMTEHEGRFHLSYSGQGANQPLYSVGVATGPTPLGPFTKRADNPILHQSDDPAAEFWGPGHHSIAPGAFGDRLMFFHTKASAEVGYDRRIRYAPIVFDADGQLALEVPPS